MGGAASGDGDGERPVGEEDHRERAGVGHDGDPRPVPRPRGDTVPPSPQRQPRVLQHRRCTRSFPLSFPNLLSLPLTAPLSSSTATSSWTGRAASSTRPAPTSATSTSSDATTIPSSTSSTSTPRKPSGEPIKWSARPPPTALGPTQTLIDSFQALTLKFVDLGKTLFSGSILKFSPENLMPQRVYFLHEELTRFPPLLRETLRR